MRVLFKLVVLSFVIASCSPQSVVVDGVRFEDEQKACEASVPAEIAQIANGRVEQTIVRDPNPRIVSQIVCDGMCIKARQERISYIESCLD